MITTLCWTLALGATGRGGEGDVAPKDIVTFSASLPAERIEVGGTYTIDVIAEANEAKGYRLAGLTRKPVPFLLQMKVPASIELTPAKVQKGEHIRAPHEVPVENGRRQVEFRVKSPVGPDDAVVINLVGYVETAAKDQAWLVRRRGQVTIRPGATLIPEPADRNDWHDASNLTIGARAVPFKLPDKDGKIYDLEQDLGRKNIILITYRAFW